MSTGIGQTAGAAIGSCICPGVGTMIGGMVGGIAEDAITKDKKTDAKTEQNANPKQANEKNIMELIQKLVAALAEGVNQKNGGSAGGSLNALS